MSAQGVDQPDPLRREDRAPSLTRLVFPMHHIGDRLYGQLGGENERIR
jgi:hypothetical protein